MNNDFVVVVARFNEDITWLMNSDIASHCIIYNKGASFEPFEAKVAEKCAAVIQSPNVGRESHTYLTHIINVLDEKNVKHKDRVHVFIQGKITDHVEPFFRKGKEIDFIKKMIQEAKENPQGLSLNHKAHNVGHNSATEHFHIKRHQTPLKESGMHFGPWLRKFVDPSIKNEIKETDVSWYIGALFAVREENIIKKHDYQYYQNLLNTVNNDPNPEAGHFLERSWYQIFKI